MDAIAAAEAKPVVLRRKTTASWRTFDALLYTERNLIERFFNKIKTFSGKRRDTTSSPGTTRAS
jgi:transposase